MTAPGVIETVDVFEHSDFNLSACVPYVPPDQLCFHGFEKGLDRRVVVTIAFAAHRYLEPVLAQYLLVVM